MWWIFIEVILEAAYVLNESQYTQNSFVKTNQTKKTYSVKLQCFQATIVAVKK